MTSVIVMLPNVVLKVLGKLFASKHHEIFVCDSLVTNHLLTRVQG